MISEPLQQASGTGRLGKHLQHGMSCGSSEMLKEY